MELKPVSERSASSYRHSAHLVYNLCPPTFFLAGKGDFPYVVQIKRGSHYCAGNIVNANWIVTAAHCSEASITGYVVVAGEHNLTTDEGTEQSRSVAQIIRHPNYNS